MRIHGLVWAGVRSERFAETAAFFREVLELPVVEQREDFAWFRMPNTSEFEVFGPADAEHGHFTTGPVPSFLVDDVHAAADELRARGVDVWGPWGRPEAGWLHFRAPDGNVYGMSAGTEYRR